MSRASWSKLGGGRLRRDCPELELARKLWDRGSHGVQAPREGARRVGLRLDTEAGLRGGAAACGAAGRAAAGAQREVLRLSGVIHAVGGPDVLHGRVLAALLGPEERVLQHPARATREAVGCAARNAHGQPRASQRSSNLARGGRQGSGPFCQAPQVPLTLLRGQGIICAHKSGSSVHTGFPHLLRHALWIICAHKVSVIWLICTHTLLAGWGGGGGGIGKRTRSSAPAQHCIAGGATPAQVHPLSAV